MRLLDKLISYFQPAQPEKGTMFHLLLARPDTTFYLLFLISAVLCFGILRPIYIYFKDDKHLSRFPAPSIAGITNLWSANHVRRGRRSLEVHQAHQQLGPVVRIQPNHISFNLPEAVNDIYGHASKLTKDHFYDTFTGNEYTSIVGTRSREDHARKRKYVSNAYVESRYR